MKEFGGAVLYGKMKELSNFLLKNKGLLSICIKNQDAIFFDKLTKIFSKVLLKSGAIKKINEPLVINKSKLAFISGGIVFLILNGLKMKFLVH